MWILNTNINSCLFIPFLLGIHYQDCEVAIYEKDWTNTEILALGVLFDHFHIPFSYYDHDEKEKEYPYKLIYSL